MSSSYSGKGSSVFAVIRDELGQNCLSVSFICFELLSGLCCGYGWPNQNFDLEPCFGWRCTGLRFIFLVLSGIICDCFLYLFLNFRFSFFAMALLCLFCCVLTIALFTSWCFLPLALHCVIPRFCNASWEPKGHGLRSWWRGNSPVPSVPCGVLVIHLL